MNPLTLLFGIVLLVGGGWLLWLAFTVLRDARRARDWPHHEATVLASGISVIGLYRTFPGSGISRQADLRYTWQVDGRNYEGHRLRFSIWRLGGESLERANADLDGVHFGSPITIHLDPDDPRQAVVHPEADQAAVLTAILLGMLFTSYGGWLLGSAF